MEPIEQIEQIQTTEQKKKYDSKAYYETFKKKHSERTICDICGTAYLYFSKQKHLSTKYHLNAKRIKEEMAIQQQI